MRHTRGNHAASFLCGSYRAAYLSCRSVVHRVISLQRRIPVASEAKTIDEIITELETTTISERSGRAMDHESEDAFERLRTAGYL